ncbi:MAG: hypothetical protein NZ528_04655 [Caldilineales bacterium]|nr:hypothetical protein [Caldilineales bacterium]MDW8316735.1 hypothetical protein [Anaerolineae bacterium]
MTIVITVTVPEGMVIAADSRQTYTNSRGDLRVNSDNAHKLFTVGPHVMAAAWGWAFLDGRSIYSHVKDFIVGIQGQTLSVEETARRLGAHLHQQYLASVQQGLSKPVAEGNYAVALMVGGYDPGSRAGRLFEVYVPEGEYYERQSTDRKPGMSWRGYPAVISRLIRGYDPRLLELEGITPALRAALDKGPLEFNIDYWAMTLQDAVDLATLLVQTTVHMLRFTDGITMAPGASVTCGGPIDVAVAEPGEPVRWVQRKTLQAQPLFRYGLLGET